jgi:hypothetical protein
MQQHDSKIRNIQQLTYHILSHVFATVKFGIWSSALRHREVLYVVTEISEEYTPSIVRV